MIFAAKIFIPFFPSTYKIVLQVSTGIKNILNNPAETLAPIVLIPMGKPLVASNPFNITIAKVFAAVSPNLANGP